MLTTESRESPAEFAGTRTFPGAAATSRLVIAATIVVCMRLKLDSGKCAHQISPRWRLCTLPDFFL
jgi:hypothetical protein